MKTFYALILFLLLQAINAQQTLLNESFGAGIPATFTQSPAASWTLHSTFGYSASPCIVTQEIGSNTLTSSIETKTINLTGIVNPTLSFKAAITKNNFMPANIALSFRQGTVTQFVARWGSGFSANTTYTIPEDNADYVPPLDSANVAWHSYTQTISPTGNTISLIFTAEFINGGYVLFDDIKLSGATSTIATGFNETDLMNDVRIFPNPTIGKTAFVSATEIRSVELYNTLGQRVYLRTKRMNENTIELDLNGLSTGIYYASISAGTLVVIEKVIIEEDH